MARVPKARRAARAASPRSSSRPTRPASRSRTATRSWACKGIENGVTRFHQVRVPAANRLGKEGEGLKIALTTLNTGRLSIPAMCAAGGKWCLKIAREWSAERVQWGTPGRRARGRRAASSRSSRRRRSRSRRCSSCPPQLADAGTKDIRIEAALAKLWSSEMAWQIADELVQIRGGRGYETADSLRGPRRAGGAGRADAARPADQPDLRGLDGDHAAADRPRGGRRAPQGGRRPRRRPTPTWRTRRRRRSRPAASTPSGCRSWSIGKGTVPTSYDEFGRLAKHLRFVERSSRKLARQTFYGMSRWQAKLEYRQAFLGRIVDIGAELFAMAAACSRAEMLRSGRRGARATRRTSWPTRSARRRGCGSRRCSTGCGATPTTPTAGWLAALSTASTPGSRRASSTSPRAPARGSPPGQPGESTATNVARRYR